MKERITYIVRDPINNEFDPSTLAISESSLSFTKGVDAAKEWQVTVGLSELGERVCVFFIPIGLFGDDGVCFWEAFLCSDRHSLFSLTKGD
jgi:hypothetical protein